MDGSQGTLTTVNFNMVSLKCGTCARCPSDAFVQQLKNNHNNVVLFSHYYMKFIIQHLMQLVLIVYFFFLSIFIL